MIVVTGAYGFIGSCMISYLNQKSITNIIAVDDTLQFHKAVNLSGKRCVEVVDRENFIAWFSRHIKKVEVVFHLGARTDTTEFDYAIHKKWNLEYSKSIYKICVKNDIPFIYASSAATYGNGENGFEDTPEEMPFTLTPLNPYGVSKNEFDKWVLEKGLTDNGLTDNRNTLTDNKLTQDGKIFLSSISPSSVSPSSVSPKPKIIGLKFFNVYGPNEYHKGRMASTIFHFFHQIRKTGVVNLFESHKDGIKNGEQKRDFIYVKDVVEVLYWLYKNKKTVPSGIYNLGTGEARSFNDVVLNVFKNLDVPARINYVPTPFDIRNTYQYFTEANMTKLKTTAHYLYNFTSLEAGIEDYVKNYLIRNKYM